MEGYESFGLMVDCSRNGVLNLDSIKTLLPMLSKMGYDTLLLYTEDTYEVPGEPYFGSLRGRYSQKEIKEIVSLASSYGIEVIPCIQTLAHLNAIFRHEAYQSIHDVDDILLVDEERTYEFIDHLFDSIEESFTSRKVHVGMDEAHMLGLGKYKDLHGIHDRTEIFIKHLSRVQEIAKKHGFQPMMWSDMFFRLVSGSGEYYDEKAKLDPEKLKLVPRDIGQVYWDYYHDDPAFYEKMIDLHRQISGGEVIFAAGVWTWVGYAPLLSVAEKNLKAGLSAAKKKGVENVFLTAWGDDGAECSLFAALPSLFYAREIALGREDPKRIEKDFDAMFPTLHYADFRFLDCPNRLSMSPKANLVVNPSKYFLYSDPLLGLSDGKVVESDEKLYGEYACKLKEMAPRNLGFEYLFEELSSLCALLEKKLTLGVNLRKAYRSKEEGQLESCLVQIGECLSRLEDFKEKLRVRWMKENKPNGLEVLQIRLGGMRERLLEAKRRVEEYISGEVSSLPELDEDILPMNLEGDPKDATCWNLYRVLASNCPI